jgi:hypothetical protein
MGECRQWQNLCRGIKLFKGIVSRDWGGLLMVSVKRYKVLDMPAWYLFSILMSPSYVKFNICML